MSTSQPKAEVTRFVSLATYAENRPVQGEIVTVLHSTHEARGLSLMPTYSRVLPLYSIHELIATDDANRVPSDKADHIAYLAFFEVTRGGCILVGETLMADDQVVGTIAGFDETHEPNHLNIIIQVRQRRTGKDLGFHIGTKLRFVRP